jgi:anthraniloyl-CoA monooxygenase
MLVDIIGGGPAGAFTARLTALRHPDWTVRLFERLPPDDTFGFGVGLTQALLRAVKLADPIIFDRLMAATHPFASAQFRLGHGAVSFGQFHSGAIRRSELLRILLDGAAEAGAQVTVGSEACVDDLRSEADVVVGADGLASATRASLAPHLGVQSTAGRGAFIWCAADVELDGTVFQPVDTAAGTFVAHAYPYAAGLSTFVIETSTETLHRAGFINRTWESDSASDEEALDYLSAAFSELLGGGRFFGNRSRWMHFTTLVCQRWSHENVVLLGDAVATVHPSLGSGTKVALESAISLTDHFDAAEHQPIPQVLTRFSDSRRPAVNRLQDRANRSQLWWESFPTRTKLAPARVALAYLSRAGVVSLDSLTQTEPTLAGEALADFAGVPPSTVPQSHVADWVLDRPLHANGVSRAHRRLDAARTGNTNAVVEVTSGDAWGPSGDEYLEQARRHRNSGAEVITLIGGPTRSDVMNRLAVAERIRDEIATPVAIRACPDHVDIIADGIVAGRADLYQPDSDQES